MDSRTRMSASDVRRLADDALGRSRDTLGRADAELSQELHPLSAPD
jgi:hypothetical protein